MWEYSSLESFLLLAGSRLTNIRHNIFLSLATKNVAGLFRSTQKCLCKKTQNDVIEQLLP